MSLVKVCWKGSLTCFLVGCFLGCASGGSTQDICVRGNPIAIGDDCEALVNPGQEVE